MLGDGAVGKTTFVKRHLTGEFEKKYLGKLKDLSLILATQGAELSEVKFKTTLGPIKLIIWDTAG